jgi:hypothetical protein
MTYQEAYNRGQSDAKRNRPPIFRSTRAYGIIPTADDPMADNWTDEDRQAYLNGYYEE